jgi:hypothetical protein
MVGSVKLRYGLPGEMGAEINGVELRTCVSFARVQESDGSQRVDFECLLGDVRVVPPTPTASGEGSQVVPSARTCVQIAPGKYVPASRISVRYDLSDWAVVRFSVDVTAPGALEVDG